MDRKMFAVKREIGQSFADRCKKMGWSAKSILEKLMTLFSDRKLDGTLYEEWNPDLFEYPKEKKK